MRTVQSAPRTIRNFDEGQATGFETVDAGSCCDGGCCQRPTNAGPDHARAQNDCGKKSDLLVVAICLLVSRALLHDVNAGWLHDALVFLARLDQRELANQGERLGTPEYCVLLEFFPIFFFPLH